MATRRVLCECSGQMALSDDRPGCLHCGRPTPAGKWRCADCQREHEALCVLEAAGEIVSAELATLQAARRAESARVHDDAPGAA